MLLQVSVTVSSAVAGYKNPDSTKKLGVTFNDRSNKK
jgi:hypothetical protein